jgi:hypothetical protein
VEAFVLRLLLLVLRKQLLCAFLSLIFLCGMMPFFVVGVLPMLEMQMSHMAYSSTVVCPWRLYYLCYNLSHCCHAAEDLGVARPNFIQQMLCEMVL